MLGAERGGKNTLGEAGCCGQGWCWRHKQVPEGQPGLWQPPWRIPDVHREGECSPVG